MYTFSPYVHDMNNHPMIIKNVDLNKNNVINLPILEKNVEKS
jgi:hypothetical protein